MKRFVFTCLVVLFFTLNILAQPPQGGFSNFDRSQLPKIGIIRGKIVEEGSNVALEYANIAVYYQRDSTLAGGVLADNAGNFVVPELTPGVYYIDAKFVGYNRLRKSDIRIGREKIDVNIGTIELKPAAENLAEAKVYAQDKPIVYQIDKKVIDPAQIATATNGTAVDVLANTPSVSVDIEGNVSLRGSSNFTVLVDGRPTPFAAVDALQQIPASTIRNIEIITNPSAKFDPDGNSGIININTKKSKVAGVSGIVNATADSYGSLTGDFLLNYKTGKFNFFAGGNKANRYGQGKGESLNITYGTDTITTTSVGLNEHGNDSWSAKTGFDYYINDKNTLSVTANLSGHTRVHGGTNDFQESSTSGYLLNSLTKSNDKGVETNMAFNIDYKKSFQKVGHELTAFIFYESGGGNDLSYFDQFLNDTILFNGQKNWENGKEKEFRIKADYVYPINAKMKLEAGYQTRLEQETGWNDVHWYSVADNYIPSDTSRYYTNSDFKQNIHSIYATWSNAGRIFGYQLGLRTEYTDWKISYTGATQDYLINRWDLFPTVHLSFNISEKQQLTTSYTRRIQRPRGYYFEPFKTYTDAYNVRQGNPAIQPEYIDSYEMGYQLQLINGFVSTEVYHRKTNNKIDQIRSVYSENVMLQTVDNIGKDYSTGVELMLNYKPAKWWSFNLMGNLYRYRIVGNLNGRDVDQQSNNWNARLSNTFNITKTTKLQIDGMYNSPTTSAQGHRDGFAFTNLAVRQDLFKNKLNVTFSIRDVLNTAKFGFESSGTNFYSKTKSDMKSPIFSLTLSYKINNFKQQKQRGDSENGQNGQNGEMNGMDMNGGNE
jgi:outer membrane receptor protein involved in Fe transport